MSDTILNGALALAGRGWHVMPVRSDKRPFLRDWPKLATTDPELIERWWKNSYRNAQLGVVTGRVSGIIVIDVDPVQML